MKLKEMPRLPLVIIALMFAVGAYVYPHLPAQIPVHWNAAGEIDGWANSTVWSVFAEPLMALGFYVLFMVMPYFDPKRVNVYKSKPVYFVVLDAVTALIMLMFFGGLAAAFNPSVPVDRLAVAGIGLVLMVLGNYMGRVKRNWRWVSASGGRFLTIRCGRRRTASVGASSSVPAPCHSREPSCLSHGAS
jgi:uncharacterized membrane protein